MLSGSNDSKLTSQQVDPKVVPLYQVWQELVHVQTLDVYQYRVLTSFSALKELLSVIKKTQQGLFTTDDNIDACRLETLYILKQDKALEKNNKALLNRLQATLGKKPTTPAEKNRLAYHLKYAIGILQPVYMEWVLTELEASVVCGNVGDIEYFANIASSQAIHNGWSPSALYDMLRFFRDSKPFSEQWDNFKNELLSNSFYSHDVLINVPFAKLSGAEQAHAQQVLNQLGLKLKSYSEIVAQYENINDIGQLIKAEKKYFQIAVDAKDIYSASHNAISKLATVLNLAALREQTSLIVYIEHLNDYLSTYISEIVTDITERNLDTFEEALCYIRDNYDVFVALCKEKQKGSLEADVLSTGVISLI